MIQDLAPQVIDYKAIFARFPGAAFVLSPSFEILDVSDEVKEVTGRGRGDLVGRDFFDAFPANPRARDDSGQRRLRTKLTRAARTGERTVIGLDRYDIEDPDRRGVYRERFWSGVVTPLAGEDGRVALITIWGYDTTPIVSQFSARAATQG